MLLVLPKFDWLQFQLSYKTFYNSTMKHVVDVTFKTETRGLHNSNSYMLSNMLTMFFCLFYFLVKHPNYVMHYSRCHLVSLCTYFIASNYRVYVLH